MESGTNKRDVIAKIGVAAAIIVAVISIYFVINSPAAVPNPAYDDFAKCLTEKGIRMYGTEWCPHCQNQKKLFGSAFQYVSFIDCDEKAEECSSQGVTGYPTWVFNGQKYEGEQSFADLSRITGCILK